jgi:hypothetical protein
LARLLKSSLSTPDHFKSLRKTQEYIDNSPPVAMPKHWLLRPENVPFLIECLFNGSLYVSSIWFYPYLSRSFKRIVQIGERPEIGEKWLTALLSSLSSRAALRRKDSNDYKGFYECLKSAQSYILKVAFSRADATPDYLTLMIGWTDPDAQTMRFCEKWALGAKNKDLVRWAVTEGFAFSGEQLQDFLDTNGYTCEDFEQTGQE